MPEFTNGPPNRRSFMKTIGCLSLGAGVLSSTTTVRPGDKSNAQIEEGDSLEERIRKSNPEDLYEYYANRYSPSVAREVQAVWTTYTEAILDERLSEEVAERRAFNELKDISPELREDIESAQQEAAMVGSNAAATAQSTSEFSSEEVTSEGITTADTGYTGEILRIDGKKGGSGIGYRDSHYYVWKDTITSIVETAVIGSLTQWV
jgi:hypothetical protein